MSVLPPKCLTPKQTTIPKYKQVERDGRHIQCLPSFFSSRFSQGFFTASRFLSKSKSPETIEISGLFWSCWADSNCRPHPYQGCALPTELQQRVATTKGLEPSTSGVTGRRSNQLNYMAVYARCRVISTQQIDYSTYNVCCKEFFLAGAERFELSTRGFGDRCSTS